VRIGLIVIFNHRYERNVALLREWYHHRFSEVLFLMPFCDDLATKESDVISVHSGSYTFQGHLAEARQRLASLGCDAYLVIGDDLLLNPSLDENNLHSRMGLSPNAAYTKCLANLYDAWIGWSTTGNRTTFSALASNDLEWLSYLPPAEEATRRLSRYGFTFHPLGLRNFLNMHGRFTLHGLRMLLGLFFIISPVRNFFYPKAKAVPYPLLYGYSDFFIVPGKEWDRFLELCQVMTAMKVFVEVAIPTCLALACEQVEAEIPYGENHHSARRREELPMRGIEFQWKGTAREDFEKHHRCSLESLFSSWPGDVLYYHPIKLSKWQ
jgi:hypothetical protein